MALIQAKWDECLIGLDVVDRRIQFESASCKWWKIISSMNASKHLSLLRNNVAYKDKWGVVYGNFKRIFDYMAST